MTDTTDDQRPIRHAVFFSCKDKADIDRVVEGLSMLADIPHASHFEVRRNLNKDRFANDVDVIVYAEFADEVAMQAYRNHEIYDACTALVRPLRDMRIAADF